MLHETVLLLVSLAICASGLRGVRWGRWTNVQLYEKNVQSRNGGGARAHTKAEQTAKDQYEATRDPVVERVLPKFSTERTKLLELRVGQKLKGRIISIKDFGMFVDVNGEKDGLVHVKDISKDYFIQNHAGKFVPGQDIEVWVKFLVPDPDGLKLGLQMFPVSSTPKTYSSDTTVPLSLVVGDAISGTVVRVSNFGVFVNVGLDFDAYLHKRKMKVARKMVKLMPWEIKPVGTKINAFVHEVNMEQRRLSITTFPPETWAKSLPPPRSQTSSNSETDEEEENGNGSALSRIMALDLDDDADEEDGVEEGVKVSVSDLSPSEIRALEQKRTRVVLDDLNTSPKPQDSSAGLNSKKTTTRGSTHEGDDLSSVELFNLISNGRPTITLKDLKSWDYLEELLESGVIDEGQLKELLKINGETGRLNEVQFDGFLDMLVDGLGFDDEDLDEGLVGDVSQLELKEDEKVGEEEEEEEEVLELTSRPKIDLAELSTSKPKTSDLFNYVFQAVSGQKGHASLDDVLRWDFVQALMKRGDATQESVSKMFEKAFSAGRSKSSVLDSAGFDKFVSLLSASPPTSAPDVFLNNAEVDDQYEEDEMTVDEAFAMLSNGKETVTLVSLLKWDVVQELIEGGALTEAKFTDLFHQAGAKGRKTLTIDQFEVLLDALSPFAEDAGDGEEIRDDVGNNDEDIPSKSIADVEGEEDDVSDEQLVQDVFSGLANGKKHVSAKDLMNNYDFVRDLMGEGLLTEDSLVETMAAVGGSKIGVTMEQFSDLIDKLVLLFDDDEDPEDDEGKTRPATQGNDVILGDEGEYYDIDLENEFTSIANGQRTISLRDLKSWELITQMENSGLSEEELLRVIEDAGVADVNKIDIDDFEAIVLSLEELGAV